MTGRCTRCAAPVDRADRFCECCGALLVDIRRIAVPAAPDTRGGRCPDCGDGAYAEGYCTACGNRRAEPDSAEASVGAVSILTDRGRDHAGNEDAAAAGILGDGARAGVIAVAVCDGVSTSSAAHLAAAAAATAGVEAMLTALAASRPASAAVREGLAGAATAAAEAGAGVHPSNAPSCTYTGSTIEWQAEGAVQITVGNVGDSRAYWLPAPPAAGRLLTLDDSVAQELISAGAAAQSAAVQRGAHTLTRWLGADADPTPWSDASVQTITAVGPGLLVLCTDGLWNYLPDPDDFTPFLSVGDPIATAHALVEHALHCGGHDNVTAAVIQIGGRHGIT